MPAETCKKTGSFHTCSTQLCHRVIHGPCALLLDVVFRSPYYNCYVGLDLSSGSWKIQSHQFPSQFICGKVMKLFKIRAKMQTWKTTSPSTEKITGKSWESDIHSPLLRLLIPADHYFDLTKSLQSGSFYRGKKPDFLQFTLRKGRLSKRDSATKADPGKVDDTTKATMATWRNHHTQRGFSAVAGFIENYV